MLIQPLPDLAADRDREQARRHPDQDTLELAAAGGKLRRGFSIRSKMTGVNA